MSQRGWNKALRSKWLSAAVLAGILLFGPSSSDGGEVSTEQKGPVEHPNCVQEIIYLGAKHCSAEDLSVVTGLSKGKSLDPMKNSVACQKIIEYYKQKGRPFVYCELVEGGLDHDTRVVFRITEGPRPQIREIQFVGNAFLSESSLLTEAQHHAPDEFKLCGEYDPDIADLVARRLKEYYRGFGFLDAQVSCEEEFYPEKQIPEFHMVGYQTGKLGFDLIYHIQEGQRYKVVDIQVTGIHPLLPEHFLTLSKGEYYNQMKVDKDVKAIQEYYESPRRMAEVVTNLSYPSQGKVVVTYDVFEIVIGEVRTGDFSALHSLGR